MKEMRYSRCPRTLYEIEIVSSILNNSESWIGITKEIIDKLQEFQNRLMLRFVEAPKQGTLTGIVELNAKMQ